MYICQDKCYRLVPEKDHRYAQVEDYIDKSFFCSKCCVIIRVGGPAYEQMMSDYFVNRKWMCPCCKARPRSYFDKDTKQEEYFIKKLRSNKKLFKKLVDEFFRIRHEVKEDSERFKLLEQHLPELAGGAPTPKKKKKLTKKQRLLQASKHMHKLDTFIISSKKKEISLFPSTYLSQKYGV